MTLEEANKVLKIIKELSVDEDWGESFNSTNARKEEAIEILQEEIKNLEYHKLKQDVGAGLLDSLDTCPECGGVFIWKMAGGGRCTECDFGEICY